MKVCPSCDKRFSTQMKLCEHDGTALQVEDPPDGLLLGDRYRLVRKIGQGGMGVVYLAEHAKLGKRIAVKFLRGHLAEDPIILARFQREARAASEIDHSGIVDVLDFGEDPEHGVYYVMEYVEGRELSDVLEAEEVLPPAEVIRLGIEIADTLDMAHEHGVVHRDLKPDNIFLWERKGRESLPKILDFGIATAPGGAEEHLTQTGAVFGTPPYMSPEQAGGSPLGRCPTSTPWASSSIRWRRGPCRSAAACSSSWRLTGPRSRRR